MDAPSDVEPRQFGPAFVVGAIQGAIAGVPCGVFLIFIVAPFQNHTWPGNLPSTLTYGPVFGSVGGALLGALHAAGSRLGSRGLRHGARFLAGMTGPLAGAVAATSEGLLLSGSLPDPASIIDALWKGSRGLGVGDFAIWSVALGVGLVVAGAFEETAPRSRPFKATVAAITTVVVGMVVSAARPYAIDVLRGCGGILVLIFAEVTALLAAGSLQLLDPLSRRLHSWLEPPSSP